MIKKYKLRLIVFLVCCFFSASLSAQINTPSGAVVPFGSNPNYGGNGIMPTTALPSGGQYGKSQDAADAYIEWKNNYTESCGAGKIRVKFDEPNRTVSEGIAYGMLLAAYAADQPLFDGLYAYWKNYPSPNSSGKLMNWRIEGCGSTSNGGTGSAADADVDVAWALLIAENQWPNDNTPYDYQAEANSVLSVIKNTELNSGGQLINGDGWGFGDNCRNPSYQSPAYYPFFATANPSNAGAWNNAVNGAYTLLNANTTYQGITTGLASDWSDPSGNRNTCNPGGLGYAATNGYGYDAARNPWRMAQAVLWNNDAQAKAILTKVSAYVASRGASGVGGPLNQNGTNYSGYAHNATFVSTFAMAVMGSTNTALMNAMYTETKNTKDPIKNTTLSGYFGNTLRCLSLFMMTGNFWKVGTTSIQEINIRQGVTAVADGSTFDFQNAQTLPPATAGKMLTFTIENLGFATLNLTGTTKVVLSGTNANQFTVTQPSSSALALGATTTFNVTFSPTSVGVKTATLTIASNDPDEPTYTINLTGKGTPNTTASNITVYDTVNVLNSGANVAMGSFTSGARGYKSFKITNTGDAPLTISNAVFSNPAFSMSVPTSFTTPLNVPIGGTAYISVGFTAPAAAGNSTSTVTFTTNDPDAASFVLNLSASSAACSTNPSNKILMDYDGNKNLVQPWLPKGAFSATATNPAFGPMNLSPTVASYVRPDVGTTTPVWDGNYDIIRYYNCGGTISGWPNGLPAFAVSTTNPTIQILMYSPAVGVEVVLSPQKPGTTSDTWLPLYNDASLSQAANDAQKYQGNLSRTTTKANQWELITFDVSKYIKDGKVVDFKVMDIQIDPTRAYAAGKTLAQRTFYIDEIKFGINPCLSDLSGILQDFDTHNNTTLEYANASLAGPAPNSVSGGLNTSPNVGIFTKTKNAATYDDGIRYVGCSNKIDFTTNKYVSMLVYSPVANASIQVSAKIPDGADVDTYPDDAAASTQLTVFANKWHRIYFDMSAITTANLNSVYALDIFFDPTDLLTGSNIFYFDDIRLESSLPCVTGIPATDILNDFEDNRYLGVSFPGATPVAPAVTYFNTIKANPVPAGINTSAIVGEFVRGTATSGTSVRFITCQNMLDLSPGKALIDLKVYSPNAGVKVTMSLKNAAGASLSDVTETVTAANTWTKLTFDHSNIVNSTAVAFIDVIVDQDATFSGAASTTAQRTYLFDDLRYSPPAPEINVKALTSPTTTDIPTTGAFSMGTIAVGDSSITNFNIQNNGLQTLTLTGTGAASLVLGGANPADFIISTTQTFTTSIGALGATGFTVKFKPTASGLRSASITITSNDANESPYVIYLNGTATAAIIGVSQGATAYPSNGTAYDFGNVVQATTSAPITFTIKNTGSAALNLTTLPLTATGDFQITTQPTSPVAATTGTTTFIVTFTPTALGVRTGTITIASNDPATPSYVLKLTGTGTAPAAPEINVKVATTNYLTASTYTFGTVVVGTATPATTFTIENTGNAVLNLTGTSKVVLSGTNAADFTVNQTTTTATVAAAASTTFTVTLNASATGTRTAVLTIASNDIDEASYVINLTATATAPEINVKVGTTNYLNASTYNFGAVIVGTATPAATFTIENLGTATLNLTGTPIVVKSGTNAADFTVTQTTTTASVAAAASTTFTVTLNASAAGARSAVLTIANNDSDEAAYVINLSATATAVPEINVKVGTTNYLTASTYDFGTVTVGTATPVTTFTIENLGSGTLNLSGTPIVAKSGTNAADFTVTQTTTTATVAGGASTTFTVSLNASATGTRTAVLTIANNDSDEAAYVINLTANASAALVPEINVKAAGVNTPSAGTYNFGAVTVGTATAATTFTIENIGTAALTLSGTPNKVALSGTNAADFTVVQTGVTGSIAAGGSNTFTVTLNASATGTRTAVLTIANSDSDEGSYVINLTATASPAPVAEINVKAAGTTTLTGGTYSFGAVTVGTASAATTFTIENTGTAALTLSGTPNKVALSGTNAADFTVVQTGVAGSIAAGGSNTFTVTVNASAAGTRTAVLTIANSDSDEGSYVINLTATASAAPIAEINVKVGAVNTASGGSAVFTSTGVGTASAATTFTIENTGTAALTLSGTPNKVAISGANAADFTIVQTGVTGSIAAGGNNTFTVTFTPSATGTRTATITIANSDSDEGSYVINLTGTISTAITNTLSNEEVDIYPNPTNGSNTFVTFSGKYTNVEVNIYNALGNKVYTDNISSIQTELLLPISSLPAGVYFVEINTAQGKAMKRLVKE